MVNKTISVFVSSTFKDMQAERDYLNKYVLPRLQESLIAKGIIIKIIDLRWGISNDSVDEESFEAKVLHVCSDAIQTSRPYFIALLGGRYGWVPSMELMNIAKESLCESEREVLANDDMSITEMEILLGALGNKDYLEHSFFCLRDDNVYASIDHGYRDVYVDSGENAKRLEKLKQKIVTACAENGCEENIIPYKCVWDGANQKMVDLEKFGNDIYEALYNDIANSELCIDSGQSEYQVTLESFVLSKINNFQGREQVLKELKEHLLGYNIWKRGTSNGVFLIGDSGSGKSSILCKLYYDIVNEADSRTIVLGYCYGISKDVYLREYWADVIAERCGLDRNSSLETLFGQATLMGYKIIALIDSLDTFNDGEEGNSCDFTPAYIPFVCTSQPHAVAAFRKSSTHRFVDLDYFDGHEAAMMIDNIMKANLKEINSSIKEKIMDKTTIDGRHAYSSPFWLKMVLVILNELGSKDFDFIYSQAASGMTTEQYLCKVIDEMPTDVAGLFSYFIKITTNYFTPDFVRTVLIYIATSKYGIKESGLMEIAGDLWNPLEWQSLKCWLRDYIRYNPTDDSWSVTHNILKEVLLHMNSEVCRDSRERYKDYIKKYIETKKEREEYYTLLLKDNDVERIHEISDPRFFSIIEKGMLSFEEFITAAVAYAKKFSLIDKKAKANWVLWHLNSYYSEYKYRRRGVGNSDYENGRMLFDALIREVFTNEYVHRGDSTAFESYVMIHENHLEILDEFHMDYEICDTLYSLINCYRCNKKLYGSSFVSGVHLMELWLKYFDKLASKGNERELLMELAEELVWITTFADADLMIHALECMKHLWQRILKSGTLREQDKMQINDSFREAMIRIDEPGWDDYDELARSLLQHYEATSGAKASETEFAKFYDKVYSEMLERIAKRREELKRSEEKREQEDYSYSQNDWNYDEEDSAPSEQFEYRHGVMAGILRLFESTHKKEEHEWISLVKAVLEKSSEIITTDRAQALELVSNCSIMVQEHIQNHCKKNCDEYSLSEKYAYAIEMVADWYREHDGQMCMNFLERIYSKMVVTHFIVPVAELPKYIFELLKREYEHTGDKLRSLNMSLLRFEINALYPPTNRAELRGIWNFINLLPQEEQERVRKKEKFRADFDRYADSSTGGYDRNWPLVDGRSVTLKRYGEDYWVWGFTDENGDKVADTDYSFLSMINENRAVYAPFINMHDCERRHCWGFEGCRYGYIDRDCNEVIPAKYDYASLFYNGEALVAKGDYMFYIDKNGNYLRPLFGEDFFATM